MLDLFVSDCGDHFSGCYQIRKLPGTAIVQETVKHLQVEVSRKGRKLAKQLVHSSKWSRWLQQQLHEVSTYILRTSFSPLSDLDPQSD